MPDRDGTGQPRVRVAIVGAGFAASSHIDALSRLRGIEIHGILSSSEARSHEAASRFGIPVAYASLDELVADPSVHAVHNCTPNVLHAEITSRLLEAGKHVLSEKPLGMDAAETAALAEQARDSDGVAGVCFNYRHFPLVQQARIMLRSSDHGVIHFVRGGYLQDWLLHDDDWNWRLESDKAGPTRAMGDIGSHWIDTVQHVTGDRIVAVMAELGRLHEERWRPTDEPQTFERAEGGRERVSIDTEDFAAVLVRFSGGARGAFTVSQVSPGSKNRLFFQIDAAQTQLGWDQEEPNTLELGKRDEANRRLPRDPSLLADEAAALARFPGGHQEGWPDALRNLFADFYESVAARHRGEDRHHLFASFEEAHHVTRVVEAVARSHREERWIEIDSTQPEEDSA